jgi:surface antigen
MSLNYRLIKVALAALTVALILSGQVQARAWEWAKRLPINQYSPEDIAILKQGMAEILGSLENGETGQWSNPETGHGGSITPMTSVQQNSKTCRQTRFTSVMGGQENVSEFLLCQQENGGWAVEQPLAQ